MYSFKKKYSVQVQSQSFLLLKIQTMAQLMTTVSRLQTIEGELLKSTPRTKWLPTNR